MRIQFGTWIHSCTFVSNPGYGNIINACTNNGLYSIRFDTIEEANYAYRQLLEKGYYNASSNWYSNY